MFKMPARECSHPCMTSFCSQRCLEFHPCMTSCLSSLIYDGILTVQYPKQYCNSFRDLRCSGYSLRDLRCSGYSFRDLRCSGLLTYPYLRCAGYSLQDLRCSGYLGYFVAGPPTNQRRDHVGAAILNYVIGYVFGFEISLSTYTGNTGQC